MTEQPAPGKWQRIKTDAGWHLRLVGANGEIVLTSEVYTERRTATEALAVVLNSVAAFATTFTQGGDIASLIEDIDQTQTDPRRGTRPWYIARCEGCDAHPMFRDYNERAAWVGQHRVGTGHNVLMEEIQG